MKRLITFILLLSLSSYAYAVDSSYFTVDTNLTVDENGQVALTDIITLGSRYTTGGSFPDVVGTEALS